MDNQAIPKPVEQALEAIRVAAYEVFEHGRMEAQAEIDQKNKHIKELESKLADYERRGGELNMANSWKKKYKYALERANARLVNLGEKPEQIRNRLDGDIVEDTASGQCAFTEMVDSTRMAGKAE